MSSIDANRYKKTLVYLNKQGRVNILLLELLIKTVSIINKDKGFHLTNFGL
jgi:hypothetical protein